MTQHHEAQDYLSRNPDVAAALVATERPDLRRVRFQAVDASGRSISKFFTVRDGSPDIPRLVADMRATGYTDIRFREAGR